MRNPFCSPGMSLFPNRIKFRAASLILVSCAAMLWLPALGTPFWGDDYVMLEAAHSANASGTPLSDSFWPENPDKFWRPLYRIYWLVVDSVFDGDAHRAHLANLCLLLLASMCVGILGCTLARMCRWTNPAATGVLSALLYLVLALHLLPVHWVSAANNSIVAIFTALCLLAWLMIPLARGAWQLLLPAVVLVTLVAALLSKESAAMIPLLMVSLSLFTWPAVQPGKVAWIVWITSCLVVAGWLILRLDFITGGAPEYELVLGSNVLRNGVSLLAWLLNVPREAARMMLTDGLMLGMLWVACTALPILGAWLFARRPLASELRPSQALATLGFAVIALAPYFLLNWNSYAYYAAIAVILPVVVLARGLLQSRHLVTGVILICLSSLVAVQGTRSLDHPSLIGRAYWAESVFRQLEGRELKAPLFVRFADEQRFYAMGNAGLAWRLGLPGKQVKTVDECPLTGGTCLVIGDDGSHRLVILD